MRARRGKTGLVILDFGRPAYKNKAYGTLDFSGTFQWNVSINKAVEAYITGYVRCRPASVKGVLSVARGTNNSCTNRPELLPAWLQSRAQVVHIGGIFVGGAHESGRKLGDQQGLEVQGACDRRDRRRTGLGSRLLGDRQIRGRVQLYGAPLWLKLPPLMWDFGSLEPGYWSRNQEWTIAAGGGGVNHVMPEIYYPGMAREWSDLSAYAKANHGARIKFGGVTSQWAPGVSACGYSPARGVGQLLAALKVHPGIGQASIARVTDFPCASSATAAAAAATGVGVPPDVYGQNGVPCESIKHC